MGRLVIGMFSDGMFSDWEYEYVTCQMGQQLEESFVRFDFYIKCQFVAANTYCYVFHDGI